VQNSTGDGDAAGMPRPRTGTLTQRGPALWRLQVTGGHCDGFYTALKAEGLGPSRIRCAHVVLHRAVAQAVRWGWLARNVVSDASRPEVPRSVIRPPEPAVVRMLLANAQLTNPAMACWLQVAVATGARRGEVCGLCWDDIDVAGRSIRIERSVSATSRGVTVKTTKTAGVRRVSITAQAADALVAHRARAEDIAWRNGRLLESSDYVFTNDPAAARPWRPELASRRWERLRESAGAPKVRLHDLRHFVATELLTAGIDVRTVANRLGHARTSTTMDIYWAFVPARDHDAAAHLEQLLRPQT
jgi:integrase